MTLQVKVYDNVCNGPLKNRCSGTLASYLRTPTTLVFRGGDVVFCLLQEQHNEPSIRHHLSNIGIRLAKGCKYGKQPIQHERSPVIEWSLPFRESNQIQNDRRGSAARTVVLYQRSSALNSPADHPSARHALISPTVQTFGDSTSLRTI